MSPKEFHKFTDAHNGQIIYVDINTIIAFRQCSSPVVNYHNTITGSPTSNTGYDFVSLIGPNMHFDVSEHISEVMAILEGRDPAPARILFKGK